MESDSSYFKPKSSKHSYKDAPHRDTAYKGLIPDPAQYSESIVSKELNFSTSKDSIDSHPYEAVSFGKVSVLFL